MSANIEDASPKVLKEGDRFAVSSTDNHGEIAVTTAFLVRAFARRGGGLDA
jgi:hypothetical protein